MQIPKVTFSEIKVISHYCDVVCVTVTMTIGDIATQVADRELDPSDGSYRLQVVGDEFGLFDLLDELQAQYPRHSFFIEPEHDPFNVSEVPFRWKINGYETHPSKTPGAFVVNTDTNNQMLIVFG